MEKEQKELLAILDKMENLTKEFNNTITQLENKTISKKEFDTQEKFFDKQDDKLYFEYNKLFKSYFGEVAEEEFLKFKNGFVDKNFINYMFKTYKKAQAE